jgi:hypothetical protein
VIDRPILELISYPPPATEPAPTPFDFAVESGAIAVCDPRHIAKAIRYHARRGLWRGHVRSCDGNRVVTAWHVDRDCAVLVPEERLLFAGVTVDSGLTGILDIDEAAGYELSLGDVQILRRGVVTRTGCPFGVIPAILERDDNLEVERVTVMSLPLTDFPGIVRRAKPTTVD